MRSENKGISLIEVIIAMAVLAILSIGGIGTYQSLGLANTKKAARVISDDMSKARIYTMSKKDRQYLYIYQIDGRIYTRLATLDGLNTNPGGGLSAAGGQGLSKNINLSYKTASGVYKNLLDNEVICISYNRSSGAFDSHYEEILLESRNQRTVITCVKETGRHWID